jgi:hypothetical protein
MTDSEDMKRLARLVEWVLLRYVDVTDMARRDRFIMQKIRRLLGVENGK